MPQTALPTVKKAGSASRSHNTSSPPLQTENHRNPPRQPPKTMTPIEKEKFRLEAVNDVVTVQDAMDRLIARQYSVRDQEYTNSFLAGILTQLTLILPAEAAALVKSMAILLDELDLDLHANRASTALMDDLREPLTEFVELGMTARMEANCLITGNDSIDNHIADISSRIDGLHAAVIDAQEQSKFIASIAENTLDILQNHIKATPLQPLAPTLSLPNQPITSNMNTYAGQARLPAIHHKVMARADE
jgi:hypothetical protein